MTYSAGIEPTKPTEPASVQVKAASVGFRRGCTNPRKSTKPLRPATAKITNPED